MRITLLLLMLASGTSAQSDAGKLVEQGFKGALAGLTPVPERRHSCRDKPGV